MPLSHHCKVKKSEVETSYVWAQPVLRTQYMCYMRVISITVRNIHYNKWTKLVLIQPYNKDFPGGSDGKVSAYNAGEPGSIPGLGKSSGEGNGNPLQYSCLENPMDGGAW